VGGRHQCAKLATRHAALPSSACRFVHDRATYDRAAHM
jgi:hypothetical protein